MNENNENKAAEDIIFSIQDQNSKDNYDALISLGLAIMQAEKAEMLGMIQEDEIDDELKQLIQRKNSKLLSGGYVRKSTQNYLTKTNGYMRSRRNSR